MGVGGVGGPRSPLALSQALALPLSQVEDAAPATAPAADPKEETTDMQLDEAAPGDGLLGGLGSQGCRRVLYMGLPPAEFFSATC